MCLAGALAKEDPASTASVERPTFTPTSLKAHFIEQFTDDWADRWSRSQAIKQVEDAALDGDKEAEFRFDGEWSVEEPTELPAIEGDAGLVLKSAAKHHALVSKFAEPLDNADNTLVLQYEVKMQNPIECGGAYIKLLTHQADGKFDPSKFDDKTPYTIMFGPDKCGPTNKVHFIFRHKNPVTGEYEEKHLKTPPIARITKRSTLYTLIVRPDNTFEILINNVKVSSGSLLQDFIPSVNPPEEIDDVNDVKPEDWVDESRIEDPDATKPDDWDEDAPYQIPDPESKKPKDWLDSEPITIPDPDAEKPDDWDDEEDGEWVAPSVPNPKCADVSGCGPWKASTIVNPDYKGKWYPPMIDNPAYKGVWKPRKIANPDYFNDKHPSNFEKIDAVGFELWTMQNEILFDNIFVGHSAEDASKFAEETWVVKDKIERAQEDAVAPKPNPQEDDEEPKLLEQPIMYFRHHFEKFYEHAQIDLLEAITSHPVVVSGFVGLLTIAFVLVMGIFGIISNASSASTAQPKRVASKKSTAKAEAEDETSSPASDVGNDGDNESEGAKKRRSKKKSRKVDG
ncbi:calreticulin [Thamnocephalis sphaerospora]|uniref:Calreticulin n=1 Tax=Thamnocephalis sphaerospora TaxID=78915 RepID=A0A4P9XTW0_9FUNG|nr:calreticulin [Thamnocephalis sphaerospora]|eukprot:RKP09627.1 calreticulin [Thamnocephalis sphaerospora]